MNTKILVAAHKNYQMPKDENLYLPIFVGKALHPDSVVPFTGDNTGDNISAKNTSFNELTAIYWAWKNLDADAIGLVHYRRYLSTTTKKDLNEILTSQDVTKLFQTTDIILPKKRNYVIESNYNHYIHAHHAAPLDETRRVISEKYPEYLKQYDIVMKNKSAHMFNMFIMKRDKFDEYCSWMFDILFELERRVDISDYDSYESRVFGFISELLLDVWLNTKGYTYKEVNFVHLEGQHWSKKGTAFLLRMLKKKRN